MEHDITNMIGITMSDTKEHPMERYRERFTKWFLKAFGIDLTLTKREKPAPPIAEYSLHTRAVVRKPTSNYALIYDEAIKNWIFRQIARAIIQEVIVPEIKLTAKFDMKCTNKKCEMEYETAVEECAVCGGTEFREPDMAERKKAQKIMDNPNPDYSFTELNRAALFWHLMVDDTYFSIAYKKGVKSGENTRIPEEVYIEDSRFIFPVADAYNNFGNDEYFCYDCYDPKIDNIVRAEPDQEEPTECPNPDCDGPLLQTYYVMEIGNKTKHRFGKDEIKQGSTDRLLPALFGNPKITSVWKPMKTVNHMDDYGEEVWGKGNTGGFIAFPDMKEEAVTEMEAKVQEAVDKSYRRDPVTGKITASSKIRTFFIGVKEKPPVFIETMPDANKMQSIEWYKLHRDSMCAVFGVTPIFVSIIESGKSGNNPRMQIDVQKGTTEEHQQFLQDMWNNKIFPVFKIYDWEIQFGSIEQVDDLRQAQVWEHRGKAAEIFINLGFQVTLDEHGNIDVSKEREEPNEQEEPDEGDQEGESEPMPDEIDEETGNWPVKTKLIDEPESAKKIRLNLEKELGRIIDEAKAKNNEKASYAEAKEIMNKSHLELIEAARVALSHTFEQKLPKLPDHIMRKLETHKKERLKDFRKLLKEELKREGE